jgi:hypothetical protein
LILSCVIGSTRMTDTGHISQHTVSDARGSAAAEIARHVATNFAEELAMLMAEHLGRLVEQGPPRPWTVREVAQHFAVSEAWVYEHWTELGGYKLGSGPKAPLRFSPDRLPGGRLWREARSTPAPPKQTRRRTRSSKNASHGAIPVLMARPRM